MTADHMEVVTLTRYRENAWYDVTIRVDVARAVFDLEIDAMVMLKGVEMLDPVESLERISFLNLF